MHSQTLSSTCGFGNELPCSDKKNVCVYIKNNNNLKQRMYSTLEHLVVSFLKVNSTNTTEKIESAGEKKSHVSHTE